MFAFPSTFKSTKFQLIVIVSAALYICMLLTWKYKGFHTAEPDPQISEYTTKMKRHANNVEVGLHIQSFPNFSFYKNDFLLDGIVWFRFPQGTESIETIEKFTVKNAVTLQIGKPVYKSEPIVRLVDDHVIVAYHIQSQFKTMLNYRLFPIGDHKLSIILQNRSATPNELVFVSKKENFYMAPNLLVQNWHPYNTSVKTGYVNSEINPLDPSMDIGYPCIVFSIDFENIGLRDLISLYFPMFVLFLIGLFSLAIDINEISRLGIIASSLPILVLFRIVIDGLSPAVGYNTHVDFVYYLLVFLSLLLLFFQTYVVLVTQRMKDRTEKEKLAAENYLKNASSFMLIFVLLTLVTFMTYNHFMI